jgi:Na+-transporting NADH:ubiquinone oxidoreductase subunit F
MRLLAFAVSAFVLVGLFLTALVLLVRRVFVRHEICSIYINDNPGLTKSVETGQTLLHALNTKGISIPSSCGGKGSCKQCGVQIIEGGEAPSDIDRATFTKKQLSEGWRLACQVKVCHDMSIHLDETIFQVREWVGKVVSNENVSSFIKELIVELPEGMTMDYRSGGYVQIVSFPFRTNTSLWKETIDKCFWSEWEKYGMFDIGLNLSSRPLERRAFSFASYPAEKMLKFNIRIASPPLEEGKV